MNLFTLFNQKYWKKICKSIEEDEFNFHIKDSFIKFNGNSF